MSIRKIIKYILPLKKVNFKGNHYLKFKLNFQINDH